MAGSSTENFVAANLIGSGERTVLARLAALEGCALYGPQNPTFYPDTDIRALAVFAYDINGNPGLLRLDAFHLDSLLSTNSAPPMWLRAGFDDINRISIQASSDLKTWRVLSDWTATNTSTARDPQLLFHANRWWMVYGNGGFTPTSSFSLAVSDDLLSWEFVTNISCAPYIPPGGMVWQPITAHDKDGNVYAIAVNINESYLFLRPTEGDDLSTLAVVKEMPLLLGVPQSAFYQNGFYYIFCNNGGSHVYYTSASPDGPYELQGTLDGPEGDAVGMAYDKGIWYCFRDGPELTLDNGCVAYQTSTDLSEPFGDIQLGMIEALIPRKENLSKNPSARCHYGWAAQGIRGAVDRVLAVPQRPRVHSKGPLYYNASGTGATAGEGTRGEDYRPKIVSGTSASARGYAVLFNSPFMSWTVTGNALLSTLRSFEVITVIESSYHANSIIRLLVGVPDTSTTLTDVGIGMEFKTTTVDLLIHDGTTLHRTSKAWTPRFESTIRIVRYFGYVRVEIDGVEFFVTGGLPLNGEDLNWRAINLVAEYVSGGAVTAFVKESTFRFLD